MDENLLCPVCSGVCTILDSVDFNKSCEERNGKFLSPAGISVNYALCIQCGFCFAPGFANWKLEEFEDRIYNDNYPLVDPDYFETRPRANANNLISMFGDRAHSIKHLDYGGGNGLLAELLRKSNWQSLSYDPFVDKNVRTEQIGKFDLITAFEVFEHIPDVRKMMSDLSSLLSPNGLILFSTLLSDGNIKSNQSINWWYASPRNGHISLFSRKSLSVLAQNNGFNFGSISATLHAFGNKIPHWAEHILKWSDASSMNHSRLNNAMMQAQGHAQAGRLVEAEAVYRNIIVSYPKFHPVYQEFGLLAYGAGNLALAAELFETAIALDHNVALYHRNFGELCRRLGRFDEAVKAGAQACKLSPSDVNAHFNLGLACSDAKDATQATHAYRKVLELLEPRLATCEASPQMWNMRGHSLHRLGRLNEARKSYEHALELQPDFPVALNSLGSLLTDIGLVSEALGYFSKAVNIAPEFAMARLNLGMAQLKLGDWQNGWDNYEARWTGSAESGNGTFSRPTCPLPQWEGQGDTGQQGLLVFAEQGFGDMFQFSRYLVPALNRFAKVGFVCPDSTTHLLMDWSYGESVVLLKRMPVDYETWHWQCPLMSLPRAFQTRLNTIPTDTPYLKVPKLAQAHWRERLDAAALKRFTVGVAWTGRRTHMYDAQRSLRFEQFSTLLKDKRITWLSLQKIGVDEPHPAIPKDIDWIDWTEELIDFADTAALVANLDLVISIDSSMVHLAGGLGRPVWMLNRFNGEWRWLEQRADSPWYPTLRIFNQLQLGDWASVLDAVQSALAEISVSL